MKKTYEKIILISVLLLLLYAGCASKTESTTTTTHSTSTTLIPSTTVTTTSTTSTTITSTTAAITSTTSTTLGGCNDSCGDRVCQRIVCEAVGCPCAETPESCPGDCRDTISKDCASDSDCACGVDRKTGLCAYGNKREINASKQCPDYCSGVTGKLVLKCVNKKCIQRMLMVGESNPAAVYAYEKGYECKTVKDLSGESTQCLVQGEWVDEWDLYMDYFCEEHGAVRIIEETDKGPVGYCYFPDGRKCEQWAFQMDDAQCWLVPYVQKWGEAPTQVV